MEIVEVLSVNQQVQHVVTLATNLKPHLHPVKSCCLKELGGLERSEQISETRNTKTIVSFIQYSTVCRTVNKIKTENWNYVQLLMQLQTSAEKIQVSIGLKP